MKTPTSILRLIPHLIPLPSDRSLSLASPSAQLQRAPVESKKHCNTIREQRSTSINNIRSYVYWPHTNIYHKICKNMEENLNRFIDIKKRVGEDYNQLFWPSIILSARIPSSPHEKLRSPNTMMLQQETIVLPSKIKNSNRWISWEGIHI